MAPRTDRTTLIPSAVASPVTTNHAAKGSVFVNLRSPGNLKLAPRGTWGLGGLPTHSAARSSSTATCSHSGYGGLGL